MNPSQADGPEPPVSGGSYALLRSRLADQAAALASSFQDLNEARQQAFGATGSKLIGKTNVLTSARCVPVDMARVGDLLLFGYRVFVGLKAAPSLDDVLALYRLREDAGHFKVDAVPLAGSFLDDPQFLRSFTELFTYYTDARLVQISRREQMLFVAFRIGQRPEDLRVYRWQITADAVSYLDDQGHIALTDVRQQDVDWHATTRDQHIQGAHPHVSVLDRVFVDCTGGDLTIKLENNTQSGLGIYREPVEDPHQTVADAEIHYAEISGLILLRVRPNRERQDRYLIFNPVTERVYRADGLSAAVKRLPEGHGILFPDGYALASGEFKRYDDASAKTRFFQQIAAPNGEDLLYCFFDAEQGAYLMYAYNLVTKQFDTPLHSHGYSLYPDGRLLVFRIADNAEASSIHPLRVWHTAFMSADHYARQTGSGGGDAFLRTIGNAELVRAISELNTIVRLAASDEASLALYQSLIGQCRTTHDRYPWLREPRAAAIGKQLDLLAESATQILDEYAKVRAMQARAAEHLSAHTEAQQALISQIKLTGDDNTAALLELLAAIRTRLGQGLSLREEPYIDLARLETSAEELGRARAGLSQRLIRRLQDEQAYAGFHRDIQALDEGLGRARKTFDLERIGEQAMALRAQLDLINEEVAGLEVEDSTLMTRILDLTSHVTANLNAVDARRRHRQESLRKHEAEAEFASQFKLLAQATTSALGQVTTPDQADQQLARMMGLVERLETRFADFDQFLGEIYAKRDEIQNSFEALKQQRVAAQQRRIDNLARAAEITAHGIEKRAIQQPDLDALNAFFAADTMVTKLRHLAGEIRELGAAAKADGLEGRLKALEDQALRALRDKQDIFEQGGAVLRLGRHRFSVQRQDPEIALVPRGESLALHVTGTDYYQDVDDQTLLQLRPLAAMDLISESPEIYRAELLAYLVLQAAERGAEGLTVDSLEEALKRGDLGALVARFAAPRYREGYLKGVHDHDASLILGALLPLYRGAGLLRYSQDARARAILWLSELNDQDWEAWSARCRQALLLEQQLGSHEAADEMVAALGAKLQAGADQTSSEAAEYLLHLFAQPRFELVLSREAQETAESYLALRRGLGWRPGNGPIRDAYHDHRRWLRAYSARHSGAAFVTEAAVAATLAAELRDHPRLRPITIDFALEWHLEGLLGRHERLRDGQLRLSLDHFLSGCRHHVEAVMPAYERFVETRRAITDEARRALRLSDLKARPLTTFVRNRLINESYLPLFGDNLAKQIGALGDVKRSDQMGLLLLISPPGYGKTTLVEYLAGQLGLIFVKVNGPAIGHEVNSLDPARAPNLTARTEIERLNLAFELGNNVLLYLDDIQHSSPALLQKFIPLSDATRRIEGVWRGRSRTYDLRGKRFAVVMAGNPYTESGETFQIPDMLANRADIYNLGDMLSDQKAAFELSYIENSLTSNPILAPLATRDPADLYRFARMARGEDLPLSDMTHAYSEPDAAEIVAILERLMKLQGIVLKVNQAYIASAATAAAYRTEPAFKLQGSYRNMNKLAEKVVAVMSDDELDRLITDHYQGEAQTLAAGTEENLLKLRELLGKLTTEQQIRWDEIKQRYREDRDLDEHNDPGAQVVDQLDRVNRSLNLVAYSLYQKLKLERGSQEPQADWQRELDGLMDGKT